MVKRQLFLLYVSKNQLVFVSYLLCKSQDAVRSRFFCFMQHKQNIMNLDCDTACTFLTSNKGFSLAFHMYMNIQTTATPATIRCFI